MPRKPEPTMKPSELNNLYRVKPGHLCMLPSFDALEIRISRRALTTDECADELSNLSYRHKHLDPPLRQTPGRYTWPAPRRGR